MKDYEYIAFDAQYYLVRHFEALKSRTSYESVEFLSPEDGGDRSIGHIITKYELNVQDIVTSFYWSVIHLVRDYYSCDKILLLWDKRPYHKDSIISEYKGSRPKLSQDDLDDWDILADPQGYLQAKEDLRVEKIKAEAKYFIINHLGGLGLTSIISTGYEADDLAIIFSKLVENNSKRSAICSVDSDWMYWINKNVDFIHAKKYEVWTESDVIGECEGMSTELGISILELKFLMDSLFYSHNDLKPTTKLGWHDFKYLYDGIKSGSYQGIDDVEQFKLNMQSYDIESYSDYKETLELLKSKLSSDRILTETEYMSMKSRYSMGISKSYFNKSIALLSTEYYKGT